MADKNKGALSQLGAEQALGALSALAQDPIDDKRPWLAYAAGALTPTRSGSFGESLGGALGAMNNAQAQQEALRAQYVPHITQSLLKAAEFQRQREQDEMLAQMFGMGQPAPQATLSAEGGMPAGGESGLPPIAQQGASPIWADINKVAALKAMRGIDILPHYKTVTEGIERKPNTFYEVNGKSKYIPDPTKGITLDENGNVIQMPNFAKTNAEIEGAKTAAVKRAENANTIAPADLLKNPDGTMTPRTVGQLIEGNPSQPSAPTFQGEDLLSQLPANVRTGLLEDARKSGASEFDVNYQLPSGKVVRGAVNLAGSPDQSQQSQTIGQSTVDAEFQKSLGTSMGKDITEGQKTAESLREGVQAIDKSLDLIQQGAILGAGADLKTDAAKLLSSVTGIEVSPDKVSNTDFLRSTLGLPLLAKAKALGYNPTDADAKRLDSILGTISKDPNALPELLKFNRELSIKAIQAHNKKASGVKGPYSLTVELPSEYVFKGTPKTNTPAPAAKTQPAQAKDIYDEFGLKRRK